MHIFSTCMRLKFSYRTQLSFFPIPTFSPLISLLSNLPRIALIWSAFITSGSSLGFLETLISLRTIKAARLRDGLRAMNGEQWQTCFFFNSFHLYLLCVFHFFSFSLYFTFQTFSCSPECLVRASMFGISVLLKPLILNTVSKTISLL